MPSRKASSAILGMMKVFQKVFSMIAYRGQTVAGEGCREAA